MVRFPRILLASLIPAILMAACSTSDSKRNGKMNTNAYVYNAEEFNRGSPTFAKEPTKIDSVTICYNKYGTNPAVVVSMATEECQRFNTCGCDLQLCRRKLKKLLLDLTVSSSW